MDQGLKLQIGTQEPKGLQSYPSLWVPQEVGWDQVYHRCCLPSGPEAPEDLSMLSALPYLLSHSTPLPFLLSSSLPGSLHSPLTVCLSSCPLCTTLITFFLSFFTVSFLSSRTHVPAFSPLPLFQPPGPLRPGSDDAGMLVP